MVLLSVLHVLLFLWLFRFRVDPFPVQVRLAYLFWVSIGKYVPSMIILMYITTVGLAANLFLNYCPLARLMHLMPWNRTESLPLAFLKRVFLRPPSQGRFIPRENGQTTDAGCEPHISGTNSDRRKDHSDPRD